MLGAVMLFRPWGARMVTSPSGPVLVIDWAIYWSEKIDPAVAVEGDRLDRLTVEVPVDSATPIIAVTAPRVGT